jgi:nucleotide-binding universal stress UspA family protein
MTDRANKTSGGTRCILVGIEAAPEFVETPALEYAISLAADCEASLSLYVFAPPPSAPWPVTTGSASAWLEHETERLEQQTAATTRAASKLVSQAGVNLVAEHANALFEPRDARFVQLARVHDVVILDAADAADSAGRRVIEDMLFDSGRPVVVISRFAGNVTPRRIAIAWDGSARAARAVKDALPFLIGADLVVAVTITGEKDLSRMAPGADLASYLARHGITNCKLATLAGAGGDVAARLRLFVAEEDVEMIVMGAFVHSRFREAVLGGVTRSMLDDTPVPLFLSH